MSKTFKEYLETNVPLDNRDATRKDVANDCFHIKYGTVTCPHCGCTLTEDAVMTNGYCYVCGGGFNNIIRPNHEKNEGSEKEYKKELLVHLKNHQYDDCDAVKVYIEDVPLVIEALEKQISKKPSQDSLDGIHYFPTCPNCNRGLEEFEHHCECGQAIDWSDQE